MKLTDGILIAAAGLAAYALLNKRAPAGNDSVAIPPGIVTPAGNIITQPIASPAQGVNYINTEVLKKNTSTGTVKTQYSNPVKVVNDGNTRYVTVNGRTTTSVKTGNLRRPGYVA